MRDRFIERFCRCVELFKISPVSALQNRPHPLLGSNQGLLILLNRAYQRGHYINSFKCGLLILNPNIPRSNLALVTSVRYIPKDGIKYWRLERKLSASSCHTAVSELGRSIEAYQTKLWWQSEWSKQWLECFDLPWMYFKDNSVAQFSLSNPDDMWELLVHSRIGFDFPFALHVWVSH